MELAEVFEKDLSPKGLRGDTALWGLLKNNLCEKDVSSVGEFKDILYKVFREITAFDSTLDIEPAKIFYVPSLQTGKGGMSACDISLDKWVSNTIPALLEAFEKKQ